MSYETDSFARIEAMLEKHAPLLMRVGDDLKPEAPHRLIGPWRPPTPARIAAKMRRMRARGMTIGEIARAVRVSWRTAWLLTKSTT